MNKEEAKKLRERAYLAIFQKSFADFPQGEIVAGETPDFVVGAVGIEVTQLLNHQKESESHEDKLLARVVALMNETDLPPIWGNVHFANRNQASLDAKRLAPLLLDIILSNAPRNGDTVRLSAEDLPPELVSLQMVRLSTEGKHVIAPTRCGYVPPLSPDQVQKACEVKEQKLAGKCQEHWLLMVLEGFAPSSLWKVDDAVLAHRYRTTLDRLFLLDCFDGKCFELRERA